MYVLDGLPLSYFLVVEKLIISNFINTLWSKANQFFLNSQKVDRQELVRAGFQANSSINNFG